MLAEVAETHQRSQQQGQRQSHGDESDRHISKQFSQHIHFQPLANEIVDIKPQPLHEQNEQHDEEREEEHAQTGTDNIAVQFFQST